MVESTTHASNGGQAVTTIINDPTAKWLAILIVAIIAVYGASEARQAYDAAKHNDMLYDLVYTHQIKEEAYLAARGIPVDDFGILPKPKPKE